jgi:hypothetical protein
MAVIKYGPIVSEARGSIGGVVFTRGRAGTAVRSRVKPVYDPTNARRAWSTGMAAIYSLWLNDLTDELRVSWNTLAAETDFTNALGDTHHLSGWGLFLRVNSLLHFASPLNTIVDPPANAIAGHVPFVLGNDGAGNLTVDYDGELVVGDSVYFWVTSAKRHTVFFNRGPYAKSIALSQPEITSEPFAIPGFTFSDGDRVFFRDRRIDPDGGLSAAFFQSFDVVIP